MSQASVAQEATCDLVLAAGGGDQKRGGLHSPAPPQSRLGCAEPPPLLIFKAGALGLDERVYFSSNR